MKHLTRIRSKFLLVACSLALLISCGTPAADPAPTTDTTTETSTTQEEDTATTTEDGKNIVRLSMLSGPTGMGAAKLMADGQSGTTKNHYETEIFASNDQVVAQLSSGSTDIAALSTSVAATLLSKNIPITVLTINTEGVLYLLEKGDTITSFEDVVGKTIWATGQGANPEYILNELLSKAGIHPVRDVTIEWMTAEEVSAKMTSEEAGICMLPVPATTALMLSNSDIKEVIDLGKLWSSAVSPVLPMGCVVVRNQFLKENPDAVNDFMEEYAASIAYMEEAGDDQAQLVADFGITPSAAVAKEALPKSSLCFITGLSMKANLESYYQVMFKANPDSIGGGMPYDDFYYVP